MREISSNDLADLARGAAVLGTGGGGDPHVGRLLAEAALREHGPVTLVDVEEVPEDAVVLPVAMMGAPTVMVEKLPSADQVATAVEALAKYLGRTATHLACIEAGGVNSTIPFVAAAQLGLPLVDGDGMGRAFPELQMETFSVYGITGSPLAIAGENDETAIIDTGADNRRMESFARALTIRLGGVGHIAEYAMTGADVRRTAVPRTLSLALALGRAIREARAGHRDPVAALRDALAPTLYSHLRVLFRGKVVDVERRTVEGFARGRARFRSHGGDSAMEVEFQNENLVAVVDGVVRCVVPDLIVVLEADTAEPITTEGLRYGQRVTVVGISTPDLMRTPAALATFGPAAFGLDRQFAPVELQGDDLVAPLA
jgi:uncharacterized protein